MTKDIATRTNQVLPFLFRGCCSGPARGLGDRPGIRCVIAERYLVSSCTVRAGKEGVSVASLHGVLPGSEAWPPPGFGQILGRGP